MLNKINTDHGLYYVIVCVLILLLNDYPQLPKEMDLREILTSFDAAKYDLTMAMVVSTLHLSLIFLIILSYLAKRFRFNRISENLKFMACIISVVPFVTTINELTQDYLRQNVIIIIGFIFVTISSITLNFVLWHLPSWLQGKFTPVPQKGL